MTRNGPYHTHKHVPVRPRAYPPPPKPDDIKNPKPTPPPPMPQPVPAVVSGGSSSGFLSNVFQGFSFGLGSSVAHHTVSGIMNSGKSEPNPVVKQTIEEPLNPCMDLLNKYIQCSRLETNRWHDCDDAFIDYRNCLGT